METRVCVLWPQAQTGKSSPTIGTGRRLQTTQKQMAELGIFSSTHRALALAWQSLSIKRSGSGFYRTASASGVSRLTSKTGSTMRFEMFCFVCSAARCAYGDLIRTSLPARRRHGSSHERHPRPHLDASDGIWCRGCWCVFSALHGLSQTRDAER